jgi:hypothetical protein
MGGESKCGIEVSSPLYFSNPHFRSRLVFFRRSNSPIIPWYSIGLTPELSRSVSTRTPSTPIKDAASAAINGQKAK